MEKYIRQSYSEFKGKYFVCQNVPTLMLFQTCVSFWLQQPMTWMVQCVPSTIWLQTFFKI